MHNFDSDRRYRTEMKKKEWTLTFCWWFVISLFNVLYLPPDSKFFKFKENFSRFLESQKNLNVKYITSILKFYLYFRKICIFWDWKPECERFCLGEERQNQILQHYSFIQPICKQNTIEKLCKSGFWYFEKWAIFV